MAEKCRTCGSSMQYIDYDEGLKSKDPKVVERTKQRNAALTVRQRNKGKYICKKNENHPRVFVKR